MSFKSKRGKQVFLNMGTKQCKWCKSKIDAAAVICHFCSHHQSGFWAKITNIAAFVSIFAVIITIYQTYLSSTERVKAENALNEISKLKVEIESVVSGVHDVKKLTGESANNIKILDSQIEQQDKSIEALELKRSELDIKTEDTFKAISDIKKQIHFVSTDYSALRDSISESQRNLGELSKSVDAAREKARELRKIANREFAVLYNIAEHISNSELSKSIIKATEECRNDNQDCLNARSELYSALSSRAQIGYTILRELESNTFMVPEDAFSSLNDEYRDQQLGSKPTTSLEVIAGSVLQDLYADLTDEERKQFPELGKAFSQTSTYSISTQAIKQGFCFQFRYLYDETFSGYIPPSEKYKSERTSYLNWFDGRKIKLENEDKLFWERYCKEIKW